MLRNRILLSLFLPVTFILIILTNSGYSVLFGPYADNHRPVVKITSPVNNSSYTSGTRVPYSIDVSDPEDGNSKYEEINTKEVFLEVRFVTDPGNHASSDDPAKDADNPGFRILRSSNCANCHLFKGKLIGPSYSEISKRYKKDKESINLLSERILTGTSGVWGNVKMPSHPELNTEQAHRIVTWILEKGKNENLNFYTGTSGSILIDPPADTEIKQNGEIILTAIYTDHGSGANSHDGLTGVDRKVVHIK